MTDLQARPVELWIQALDLAPKSKAHVRGMIRSLWDYAMWSGSVPVQRNPMELVTIKGATKRLHKPRSLTVGEFQKFIVHLAEPFRTLAIVSVCFGLRISEALALKWADVDWLNQTLNIERRIVSQHVDATKTVESQRKMAVDSAVLEVLKLWKQTAQFPAPHDWIFASPTSLGRLPWSYAQVWDYYSYASRDAGIGHVSTHVLRHTYRSWLDAAGTSIAVQQKMMRHADIRTTLNIYGDVVTDEMAQAGTKIARFAILAFLWFYRRYALFSGPVVGTTVLIVALYATIGFLIARLIGGTWRTALLVFALASWILSGDVALRLFSIGQR